MMSMSAQPVSMKNKISAQASTYWHCQICAAVEMPYRTAKMAGAMLLGL